MTIKHYTRVAPAEWPAQYFKPEEIACRGTGMVMLTGASLDALRKLDKLREAMGHPLIVNSGYRSPEHNRAIGGAKASKHMQGIAFDISMANVDPFRFEAEAAKLGFNGIGIYPPQKAGGARNFIHIDTRQDAWRGAQWGEFPKRLSRFSPEPAPQPVRDMVRDAGPLVGAGGAVVAVAEEVEPVLREVAPWLPENWQAMIFAAIAGVGLVLAFRRALHRRAAGE